MAFENLFIRSRKSIGGIELDAVISEGHATKSRVSTNPIESGVNISDHVVNEPDILRITAQVSDTPISFPNLGQIVDLVSGLFGTSTAQNITRSSAAYNALVLIQKAREPIVVQTKLRPYRDNMVITSIDVTQDANSSRAVLLNITLQELLLVNSESIPLPATILEEGSPVEQGTSAEKKGRQASQTPSDKTLTSVTKSIANWLFPND